MDPREAPVAGKVLRFHKRGYPKNIEELLNLYFSFSPEQRKLVFVRTAIAAERIGISQRTLQGLVKRRAVLAIRVGKLYRVYLPDAERYLLQSSSVSAPKNRSRNPRKKP
jgi:excisionase family DNA binding protein